ALGAAVGAHPALRRHRELRPVDLPGAGAERRLLVGHRLVLDDAGGAVGRAADRGLAGAAAPAAGPAAELVVRGFQRRRPRGAGEAEGGGGGGERDRPHATDPMAPIARSTARGSRWNIASSSTDIGSGAMSS